VCRLDSLSDRYRGRGHRWLLAAIGTLAVWGSRLRSAELGRLHRAAVRHAPVLRIRPAVPGRQLTLWRISSLRIQRHHAVRRHRRRLHRRRLHRRAADPRLRTRSLALSLLALSLLARTQLPWALLSCSVLAKALLAWALLAWALLAWSVLAGSVLAWSVLAWSMLAGSMLAWAWLTDSGESLLLLSELRRSLMARLHRHTYAWSWWRAAQLMLAATLVLAAVLMLAATLVLAATRQPCAIRRTRRYGRRTWSRRAVAVAALAAPAQGRRHADPEGTVARHAISRHAARLATARRPVTEAVGGRTTWCSVRLHARLRKTVRLEAAGLRAGSLTAWA
jgi:hypothetical protein